MAKIAVRAARTERRACGSTKWPKAILRRPVSKAPAFPPQSLSYRHVGRHRGGICRPVPAALERRQYGSESTGCRRRRGRSETVIVMVNVSDSSSVPQSDFQPGTVYGITQLVQVWRVRRCKINAGSDDDQYHVGGRQFRGAALRTATADIDRGRAGKPRDGLKDVKKSCSLQQPSYARFIAPASPAAWRADDGFLHYRPWRTRWRPAALLR